MLELDFFLVKKLKPRSTTPLRGAWSLLLPLATLSACSGDDQGESASASSGQTTGEGTSEGESDASAGESSGESEGAGVIGHLDFTLFAPDAIDPGPLLGMAGAYHQTGFETEDLYALQALQLSLPPPPAAVDSVETHAPQPYVWGDAAAWVSAGAAMKLVHASAGEPLACRILADGKYPVYLASGADGLPAECAPDPAMWAPASDYRLVLYGGDVFEDRVIDGRVSTPPALVVSAPALEVYDLAVPRDQALSFEWQVEAASEEPDAAAGPDRIVIQIWDQYDQLISAHAADDGAFTVPAPAMATLSAGLGFITIARERPRLIPFKGGALQVITRYQVWGYIDLVE
jgi:hypothetical protein